MDSRLVLGNLGRILDIMETLHKQLILNEVLESSKEALLLLGCITPLVEYASLSADEDPLAVPSLKDEHELGSSALSERDVLLESLEGTLSRFHILIVLLLLEQNVVLQHVLLLTLLAHLLIVDVNVAVGDELLEHHSSHVETMSFPVI